MLLGLLTSLFCHWYCLPPSPPSSPPSCPLLQCRDLIGKHSLLVSYNFLVEICQVFLSAAFFSSLGFSFGVGGAGGSTQPRSLFLKISFGPSGIEIGFEDLDDSPVDSVDDFLEFASVSMEELRLRFMRSRSKDLSMEVSSVWWLCASVAWLLTESVLCL